ncbi:MAG: DUF3256 family protein [Saprospiraceae bacterium]|nr:DUF3256 family protein [Saprospiraceae bacterium]
MKYLNLFFILLLFFPTLSSQTIADLFTEVPDTSIMNLTKDYRLKIVKNHKPGKTSPDKSTDLEQGIYYFFEILDLKNGYLKLSGAMEGHIQMCYWNMEDKSKLIAVYQEGCGPGCYVEKFDFYRYKNKVFTPLDFKKIIPDVYNDFIKGDKKTIEQLMEKDDIAASLLFDLPRNGKNITAKWGNLEPDSKYRKYAKGNRMVLQWNNGTFRRGEVFWK